MRRFLTLFVVLMAYGVVGWAADLDLTPLHREIPFFFGNPGARSLGMAGAFIGRADDASAAEANPAGLTVISKRELTLEFRGRKNETPFPIGGQVPAGSDLTLQPTRLVSSSENALSFASFAMPLGPVVIAAYYSVPLNYQNKATLSPGASIPVVCNTPQTPAPCYIIVSQAGQFAIDYKSTVMGLAAGWQLGRWSFGAAAKRQSVNLNSDIGPPSGGSAGRVATASGSESKVTYSGGIRWLSGNENVGFGAVYKKGATYDIGNVVQAGTACSPVTASTIGCPSPFVIPDQYGIGMSLRWKNGFTLNEDIVKVKYSQLLKGFVSETLCQQFGAQSASDLFCAPDQNIGFGIPDATELHVGAEWILPRKPVALRLGVWREPNHALQFNVATFNRVTQGSNAVLNQRLTAAGNAIFGEKSRLQDQTHIAGGFGYLARSFELNVGYDHAERSSVASFSVLFRF